MKTLTQEEFKRTYGGLPEGLKTSEPSLIGRVSSNIQKRGENVYSAISGEGQYADKSALSRGVSATAETFGAVSSTAYNVLPDFARKIVDKVAGGVSDSVNYLADKISDNLLLQEAMVSGNTKKLEENLQIVADLGGISGEILLADQATKVGGLIDKGIQKTTQATSNLVKTGVGKVKTKIGSKISKVKPTTSDEAIKSLNNAYKTAFVNDSVAVNKNLTQLGNRLGASSDELVKNLAKEGIIPQVEGKLAKFDSALDDLQIRKMNIVNKIDEILPNFKETRLLNNFKTEVMNHIKQFGSASELDKALSQVERMFESFKTKFGESINPSQINLIRKEMNRITKAYKGEVFIEDVADSIGNVSRKFLDDIVPNQAVRAANAEIQRLWNLERTVKIFNNMPINVGVLGSQLGRLSGAVILGATALPLSGPGALVIAGIAATYGGNFVANLLRNAKFPLATRNLIIDSLKKQPDILQRLINEATEANKTYLQKLLPAPKEGARQSENFVPIELRGKSTIEKPATKINRSSSLPEQLLLKEGKKGTIPGSTIRLPKESPSAVEQRQIKQIQSQLKRNNP